MKVRESIIWLVVALLLAFLISNKHRKTGTFNWTTPLWADQAGYFVYLPGLLVYDFDSSRFPDKIEEKTGSGFSLDKETNKVVTRYTCGVAILQAPFFLIIHQIAGLTGQPQDGFSGIYHKVPDFAALFYCLLGLFFLRRFLLYYFKPGVTWAVISIIFLGTNLYYYAVDSTGMSHIYSFAMFSLALWLTKREQERESKYRLLVTVCWCLVFALIVLIRPTNILLFPFLFCMDCSSWSDFGLRVKQFFTSGKILVLAVSFLIVFLPQFLYWKYVSGSFITDSYQGYGFSNWKSPQILELWFSPNNGMFLYTPLYLVVIVGLFVMIMNKLLSGWIILGTFLLASYIYASWFIFSFGCGFGSRNFVEYTALFALPIGYLLSQKLSKFKQLLLFGLIASLVVFNVRLVYRYNKCFQGETWDFNEYMAYVFTVKKYHEELDMRGAEELSPENEFSKTMYIPARKLYYLKYKKAVVRTKVKLKNINSQAALVLSVETPDSSYYWNAFQLKDKIADNEINKNVTVEGEFVLPVPFPKEATILTYIWNKNKESLSVKKLELYLE